MTHADDLERAKSQAHAQYKSVAKMVRALELAQEGDDSDAIDKAHETINDDALSVQVRSSWYSPGATCEPCEYEILLCTSGPAVRIIGRLGEYGEPDSAELEYQDWFTPWNRWAPKNYDEFDQFEETLLTYARQFYFGE